ncbi:MAG: isoprenyl transferase [Firmicutes bacterium]|nr:isoprenyl transferase [Bacillota bacterium]
MRGKESTKEREMKLFEKIQWDEIPQHIAIIMDGNGRWARERGLPRIAGHQKGADVLRDLLEILCEFRINFFTVYAFSTENWRRPDREVEFLMELPHRFLNRDTGMLMEKNIKFKITGCLEGLPSRAQQAIHRTLDKTAANTGMVFNMAINYGGRSEIVMAARAVAARVLEGQIREEEIDERLINANLHTFDLPDPDLIIRTGGEMRLSNFLLWQAAYAELFFLPVYWPDFRRIHLLEAIHDFQKRQRRFGGLEC